MHIISNKKGVILVFVLVILVALLGLGLAFLSAVNREIKTAGAGSLNAKAFYIAEAGRARARYMLTTGGQTSFPYGETDVAFGGGTYSYTATTASNLITITSDGYIPNRTSPLAHRRVVESNITAGGGNLSIGSTPNSSGHQGQNTEGLAIDANNGTGWVAKDKGGSSWLSLDYGSAKTVSKVIVNGSNMTSVVVQYSNNGTSWTNVSSPSGNLPGTRTFTPVTRRYLRLSITASSGNRAQVNEFESYAGSGAGSTLSQGKFGTSL